MIIIRNQKEMKDYYVAETDTYVFKDDVAFLCNVDVEANIDAREIEALNMNAYNINAYDIKADHIKAYNIKAYNIDYYAVCVAHGNIVCESIRGRHPNAKHFVLDGELIIGLPH